MPLPDGTTLSIQGVPKPGDVLYTKPKQAMLVRMTSEALEALEASRGTAAMEFEFGDNPGIHIGDAFFPMSTTPETNHELYLRQATAAKPNAPLKLYGNILGKLRVNPELGEKIEERVRESTRVAEEQRTERKTIRLDGPLDLGKPAAAGKKKKDVQNMFRKPLGGRNLSASSGTQATRGASPRVSANAQAARPASPAASTSRTVLESDPGARGRLIHFLAARPCEQEETILRRVSGGQPTEAKRAVLLTLLEEVGMKSGDRGPRVWQLKPPLWTTEVRPYEQKFSAALIETISKNAVVVFEEMKLPSNHKAWDNVRRPRDESRPATPAGHHPLADDSVRAEPKRAIMKEAKTAKAKTTDAPRKRKANEPIPMKDESVRPHSTSKGKERAADTATPDSSSGRPSMRRFPGSGFKARASGSGTPPTPTLQDSPGMRAASPAVLQPPKRTGPVDVRQSKRSMPPPSGTADPAPPIAPPAMQERKVSSGSTTKVATQRKAEEDRAASKTAAAKKAAREVERNHDLPTGTSSMKKFKKRVANDDDDYSDRDAQRQKKRKVTETKVKLERERDRERERESDRESRRGRDKDSDLERGRGRVRDAPIPKKAIKQEASPITVARVKVKKEASPAGSLSRPPSDAHARPPSRLSEVEIARPPSSSSSVDPQRSAAQNRRRKSPVYTSSENESPPPAKAKADVAHKERPSKPSKPKYVPIFRPRSQPLPPDAEGLKKYYRACYRVYATLYTQKTKFVMKYQDMLGDGEDEYVYISDSDSDSPLELFDPDITSAFMADLAGVEEELSKVRMAYESLEISGDSE
ncbi:uncharacterized protein B0H18DRAFT_976960 [Fomitopsis serialis]|uniref:uncharacterized protein n=1 Tax=Fomitopsis serialis TaxID=139415 RepID=UPI002008659F|nr:uncharacterized protein B0H18DRAFT_976960 [Neoantrodia serialis]KAH9935708.1 hypothetical protein B0H18DRAFT_976960 [Neoantrodia serialis]